jgi:hypothetical protein
MELRDAICDLRFLLDRGYRRKSATTFVSNKYRLSFEERNFLMRAVFSARESARRKKKLLVIENIMGEEVVLDGYNVLITVESALQRKELILCDDGFIRDTAAVFGKHKITGITLDALDKIIAALGSHQPEKVTFVFDSQVSRSGELCRILREKIAKKTLHWEAMTSAKADHYLKKDKKIVSTSDSAIIEKAEKVIDLPHDIAQGTCKIKKLPSCEDIYELKSGKI